MRYKNGRSIKIKTKNETKKIKLNKCLSYKDLFKKMGVNDVIDMMLPYLVVFFCILFVVCCFMRNCYCGMTARELREISEQHEERLRQNEIRLAQQIVSQQQRK